MSELKLLLAGACALAAFLAVGGSASAMTSRPCDGDPYDNTPLIHDFYPDTPDTYRQHEVSEVLIGATLCGTDIEFPCAGSETFYDHATIGLPPGVEIGDTAGQEGRLAGFSAPDYLYFRTDNCEPERYPGDYSEPSGDSKSICASENENLVGGPVPGEVVACYRSDAPLGDGWIWATRETDGSQWLTFGPVHPIAGYEVGVTKLRMRFCDYFSLYCEYNGDFVMKNGDASILGCAGGKGLYTITATRRDGFVTPPASHCVEWSATKVQRFS